MGKTIIEWATHTWNPITGCTPISEGCDHCYARRMANRLAGRYGYPADDPFRVTFHPERLSEPLRWKKPRRIFVCSMSDFFHDEVDSWWIDDILDACRAAPQHTYMFLTKRPQNILKKLEGCSEKQLEFIAKKAWLGVTVENQARADERIPILLQLHAALLFVSVEPMLWTLDLYKYLPHKHTCRCPECFHRAFKTQLSYTLDWVICGGETGPGARPMKLSWARDLRDQCKFAGVPFFFKKVSRVIETPDDLMIREAPQ